LHSKGKFVYIRNHEKNSDFVILSFYYNTLWFNYLICNRWNTLVVDGHDVVALCNAFFEASTVKGKPTCILAKTLKGKGIPGVEDQENWHGKPIGAKSEEVISFIKQQNSQELHRLHPKLPAESIPEIEFGLLNPSDPPSYTLGEKVSFFIY